jgi:thioredoxin 1
MKKCSSIMLLAAFITLCGAYVALCSAAEPRVNLQALLAKKVPILLEFGSNCCSPCNYSKQALDDLAAAYGGKAVVAGVDVAVNKDLARDFKIRLTPTQVFITPDGKEFFRKEGNLPPDQIIQVFSKMGIAPPALQSRGPVAAPAVPGSPGSSANNRQENPIR